MEPTTEKPHPDAIVWFVTAPGPALRDALPACRQLARAALGAARALYGPSDLPAALVPHDAAGGRARGHGHPYWLAEDGDGDGLIDHFLLWAPRGLCARSLAALARTRPFAGAGPLPTCRVTLWWHGHAEAPAPPGRLLGRGRVWRSATPFVPPYPLGQPEAQLRSDLRKHRRLAAKLLEATAADGPAVAGTSADADEFLRFEPAGHQPPPPQARPGWWRLRFAAPVQGPLALGYGSHYGLGLFLREDEAAEPGVSG